MATTDLDVTGILAATGWTNATVSSLSASDDDRATDGDAGEFISADLDNAPGDFDSQNSIQLQAEARISGAGSRTKQMLMELRDSADNILESHLTGDLTTSDVVYSTPVWTRSDSQAVIDGYRFRITIQEGGGMPDSVVVDIDRMWGTLDYNLAGVYATNAYRFYDDDAAEDSSTPLDAQDTDVSVDTSSGNVHAQLRLRVDETNGGLGVSTDDWQLQVSKNAGAYADVAGASSNVRASSANATADAESATLDDITPQALAFKSDGSEVYIIGTGAETIYQYPLSSAWDLSTMGTSSGNSGVLSEITTPAGLRFKSDGTKVYVLDRTNEDIHQYPLSVAWDITSIGASEAESGALSDDTLPQGIAFKSDGTKVYLIGSDTDTIFQYPLTTAWDISSIGVTEANSGVLSEDGTPTELDFKSDGTKVYISGSDTDTVYQYPLSIAWDISSIGASEANTGTISEQGTMFGLAFKSDGGKFYVTGGNPNRIHQFTAKTAWDVSTAGETALSDGSATTNRATNGISDPASGIFVAGEQEAGNGLIEDHELTANDFTEHVWALTIISADVADTDTLDFRLLRNGSPITANVTPTITVSASTTIDRTTAFSGAATLATTATLKISATTAFAASGSLSTIPSVKVIGETAFTASGALTTAARLAGTTAAAGAGALSTAGRLLGTTAFTAAGSAASTATLKILASTAFSGAGTAATAARLTGATTFSASGAFAATGRQMATTAAAGAGTLASAATFAAATAFSASGSLTTTAGAVAQRTTAFAGAGSVTTAARLLGTTTLSATGTLSTTAGLTVPSTTAYSAAATATTAARLAGATAYAATGALATAGAFAAATTHTGAGSATSAARLKGTTAFAGSGTLTTTAGQEAQRTTAFAASGSMATTARLIATTAASASGALSTTATLKVPATTAANGAGTMATAARLVEVTVFSASGALTTTATLSGGLLERSTSFAASGDLATAARFRVITAVSAEGAITAAARFVATSAAEGSGALSATALLRSETAFSGEAVATTLARLVATTSYAATATVTIAATVPGLDITTDLIGSRSLVHNAAGRQPGTLMASGQRSGTHAATGQRAGTHSALGHRIGKANLSGSLK